jgi:hypothetical protein
MVSVRPRQDNKSVQYWVSYSGTGVVNSGYDITHFLTRERSFRHMHSDVMGLTL